MKRVREALQSFGVEVGRYTGHSIRISVDR